MMMKLRYSLFSALNECGWLMGLYLYCILTHLPCEKGKVDDTNISTHIRLDTIFEGFVWLFQIMYKSSNHLTLTVWRVRQVCSFGRKIF